MKKTLVIFVAALSVVACERLVPMTPTESEVMARTECKHHKFPMYFLPSFEVDMRNACISKEIPEAYRRADNWPPQG